jgi:hypothetical protein
VVKYVPRAIHISVFIEEWALGAFFKCKVREYRDQVMEMKQVPFNAVVNAMVCKTLWLRFSPILRFALESW